MKARFLVRRSSDGAVVPEPYFKCDNVLEERMRAALASIASSDEGLRVDTIEFYGEYLPEDVCERIFGQAAQLVAAFHLG